MPCPYFYPVEPLVWPSAPMLPLGDAYSGHCHSDPSRPADPERTALRDLCNLGYARGRCARFPAAAAPDAVRFCAIGDDGSIIRVAWVRERDHYPFDNGELEYAVAAESFTAAPLDAIGMRQAHAYVASYLRRKARLRRPA